MSRVGSRLFALTVRWLKFVLLHYCLKGMYLKLFSEIISRVVFGGGEAFWVSLFGAKR